MNPGFVDVVESVKRLSTEEKLELKDLIDNYLVEERREEILRNYEASKGESGNGELTFSSDMSELEAMLDD